MRGNKYGAVKTLCHYGHRHDSRVEAVRCEALHALQSAKFIRALEVQPKFYFNINGSDLKHGNGRRALYTADFRYQDGDDDIVEDVKGGYTDNAWPLRRALFIHLYPHIKFREVKK